LELDGRGICALFWKPPPLFTALQKSVEERLILLHGVPLSPPLGVPVATFLRVARGVRYAEVRRIVRSTARPRDDVLQIRPNPGRLVEAEVTVADEALADPLGTTAREGIVAGCCLYE